MPGPKSKISRSKRGMRRAHSALETPNAATCPTTGQVHRPHRAYKNPEDGAYYYKGKQISPAKYAD